MRSVLPVALMHEAGAAPQLRRDTHSRGEDRERADQCADEKAIWPNSEGKEMVTRGYHSTKQIIGFEQMSVAPVDLARQPA